MTHHISDMMKRKPASRYKRIVLHTEVKSLGRFYTGLERDLNEVSPKVLQQIRSVCNCERPWPIYMYGKTGVGKTSAALAITDHVTRCWYTDIADMPPPWERHWGDWNQIRRCNLVVIDDIGQVGAEKTDFEYKQIAKVFRLRNYKPTIWVSNHEPKLIDELFDTRIWDRLCKGTIIHYDGVSRR